MCANPPREIVADCCKRCPLFASKPGQDKTFPHIKAAAESASRLKRLIDSKLAFIVFGPNDVSARRASALFGLLAAENRSERKGIKEASNPKKKSRTTYID
jgi:hypothetical protein